VIPAARAFAPHAHKIVDLAPAHSSLRPRATVLSARPVARETIANPPRPIASASAPAHSRFMRSSIEPLRASNFVRMSASDVT
jgi:hypothetical protein